MRLLPYLLPVLLLSAGIYAKTRRKAEVKPPLPIPTTEGTHSVGSPGYGALYGAEKLAFDGEKIGFLPDHWERDRNYASPSLIGLLSRTAKELYQKTSRRIMLGDLSAKDGGKITGHASHQNGLDADIALFYVDASGKPVEPKEFIELDELGKSKDGKYHFDAEMQWRFIETILLDTKSPVQYIFLFRPLKLMILEAGRKAGASEEMIARADNVIFQPKNALPHNEHMHLRIYCPPDPEGLCECNGFLWSWVTESSSPNVHNHPKFEEIPTQTASSN